MRFYVKTLLLVAFYTVNIVISSSSAVAQPLESSWTERLKPSADFRLRGEYIELEGEPVRNRQRIRARLGIGYEVNEKITGQLSLTTAEKNDPVAMNQTMGESSSYKNINIYEAFVNWRPIDRTQIVLGKAIPVFQTVGKSELIWDNDLRTEGLGVDYRISSNFMDYGVNIGAYSIEERQSTTGSSEDTQLLGGQIFGSFSGGDEFSSNIYVGMYQYTHLQGQTDLDISGTSFKGNSNAGGVYLNNYNLLNAGVAFNFSGWIQPITLFYEHVQNQLVDKNNTGWTLGVNVGQIKRHGDWGLRYSYKDLEADAVVGAFTDSDFIGGGTNGRGSKYGVDYGIGENTQMNFTFFDNERLSAGTQKYLRAQLDFVFKM